MGERIIPMGPDDQKNPEGETVNLSDRIFEIYARMKDSRLGFGNLPDRLESGDTMLPVQIVDSFGEGTIQKMALEFKGAKERAAVGNATKADLVLAEMYEDKVAEIHEKMLEAGFLRG